MIHIPLSTQLILTATALVLPIGSHIADYSATHIFNPKWTPHAKFHTAQTLAFSIVLCALSLCFTWTPSPDSKLSLIAAASCTSLYWVCQLLAILYPGTAYFDADTKAVYLFGIPGQACIAVGILLSVAIACGLAFAASK